MKIAFVLVLVLLAALLCGCQSGMSAAYQATANARAGAAQVAQAGSAAEPATANERTTRTETVIPPGVDVTAHPDGRVTWRNAEPIALVSTFTDSTATGPRSHTPPAPPTPSDHAAGRASLLMRLGLVVGAALAVFGLVRGWDFVAWGGGAVAAACVLGLALASIPPWLWIVLGIGGAACVLGPVAWLKLRPRAAPPPSPQPATS